MGPFHHFPDSQGLTSNPSRSRKAFHLNLYWEIYSLIKLSSPEIHFAVFHWHVILNRCHLKACPIFLRAILQSNEVKSKLECFHVDSQRRFFSQYFGFVLLIHMCFSKFLWSINICKSKPHDKDNDYKRLMFVPVIIKNKHSQWFNNLIFQQSQYGLLDHWNGISWCW